MKNLDLYNQAYSKILSGETTLFQDVNTSLKEFLDGEIVQAKLAKEKLPLALEIGCGVKSIYETSTIGTKFHQLEAFDYSSVAIEKAQKQNSCVEYSVQDILSLQRLHQYDLIVDGHCLHCLEDQEQLKQALKAINRALRPGALFIGELMISHKGMGFDFPWIYSQESEVLFYEDSPRRLILDAFHFERHLIDTQFQIEYFYIFNHKMVIPDASRQEARNTDPQLLRFIARAKS